MRNDHHARALGANACREPAAELVHAEPPVVVVKHRREPGDSQMQLQAQVGEQHHAERNDLCFLRRGGLALQWRVLVLVCADGRCARDRQTQQRELPEADIHRVEPENVIRQRRPPHAPELRPHDSRHDEHARRICIDRHFLRLACECHERLVFAGAEVSGELARMLAARQQMLDHRVAPREAVVGSDVICRRFGTAHVSVLSSNRASERRR